MKLEPSDLGNADWYATFSLANDGNAPFAVMGDETVSVAEFNAKDVVEVIAVKEEGPEEYRLDRLIVVRLKDGRYASVRAYESGYDSDLEFDGDANVSSTLEDMIRYGLTSEEREALFPEGGI